MGLRETIQDAVAAGMSALGNLAPVITYTRTGVPAYNATSGAVSTPTTALQVNGTMVSYHKDEIDGQVIRPTDQKALILGTVLNFTPTLNDRITDANGVEWNVQAAKIDPAGALWVIQVRRPG